MREMTIIKRDEIEQGTLVAEGIRAGADRGEPMVSLKAVAPNAKGDLGIWECTPGSWPIKERENTEFCYIISGSGALTDDATGERVVIKGGDLIILPLGWSGRWEVEETIRKIYAIY